MKRRMLGATVFGLGAALLVAGCGAGQHTQTDSQQAAINGAAAQVKDIAVRDAELAYPEGTEPAAYDVGTDADAMLSIVNQGETSDQLVSAQSPSAQKVTISGDRAVPFGKSLAIGPGEPSTDTGLHGSIVLEGLTKQVRPGQTAELTLTFRDAGRVTVELPVAAPEEPRVPEEGHGESHEAEGGH